MIGSMNLEDMKAYPSEAELTSCIVIRSSTFNSGKSGLLNEDPVAHWVAEVLGGRRGVS